VIIRGISITELDALRKPYYETTSMGSENVPETSSRGKAPGNAYVFKKRRFLGIAQAKKETKDLTAVGVR